MADAVLDASAVLALLNHEDGADQVLPRLEGAAISAVNLCEVAGKLVDAGMPIEVAEHALSALLTDVRELDSESAYLAAALRAQRGGSALSLGDRACLALGQALAAPVLTADRRWTEASDSVDVIVIR